MSAPETNPETDTEAAACSAYEVTLHEVTFAPDNLEAGGELDAGVARALGIHVWYLPPIGVGGPNWVTADAEGIITGNPAAYSTDIGAAMSVRRDVHTWIWSKRERFNRAVQESITNWMKLGSGLVHPSEILLHVQPLDICYGVLAVKGFSQSFCVNTLKGESDAASNGQ